MSAEITTKIKKLKKQKGAVILVHNYQLGEVQDIADYLGDSLELSRIASKTDAKIIVFCGVHFMAETASILCPDKKVLIPDRGADCPMANMINAQDLEELKSKHPGAVVVCYVNTSAEVKAHTDICCTSTNAVKIVESVPRQKDIIFIPDKYLADYVLKKTGRQLIVWNGFCPTHVRILPEHIKEKKAKHPNAKIIAHPECLPDVINMADAVLSTSGMVKFAKETDAKQMIIGTEIGLLHRLRKENPDKTFFPASEHAVCPNMKLITLEKVLWALEDERFEVKVSEDIRKKALKSVERMLAVK